MYRIYQRNQAKKKRSKGVWWIRWSFQGNGDHESLWTADHDEAKKRAAQRWAAITAGKSDSAGAGNYTFKQAVADYGGEDRFTEVLKVALGERPLVEIDTATLNKVGRALYPGVHTRTIHRNVFTPFSAVFNRAAEDQKVPWRKFPKPKLTKVERDAEAGTETVKFVSNDYLVTWLMHPSVTPSLRAIVLLGTYTAARATIAVELEWSQVNMGEKAVYVGKEKNGKPRRVVMHPELFEALGALPATAPNDRVFGFNDRFSLAKAVRSTQKAAGLEPHGFHEVGRHTFAARYLAQGHNLRQLMEAGGWLSYGAVLIYSHLERKVVDQTIRDLPGLQPVPVLFPVLQGMETPQNTE